MKKIFTLLLLCCSTAVFAENNLIANGIAVKDGKLPFTGMTKIIEDPAAKGKYIFQSATGRSISSDLIPVNPESSYKVSGMFRGDAKAGRFLLGFNCFDAAKRKIGMHQVYMVDGTLTELADHAVKGSTEIVIADGANWEKIAGKIVVFYAKEDFSDLPNTNTHYYIKSVVRKKDGWAVTFSRPLIRNYPKGTAIRMHRDGGVLNVLPFFLPTPEWKEYSNVIGEVKVSANIHKNLWPGTRYVQLFFNVYPGTAVQFNNLKMVEIPADKK